MAKAQNAPPRPPGTEPIHSVSCKDVLMGRGSGAQNHCGNVTYRKLVCLNKDLYVMSSKFDKRKIAIAIVAAVREFGGQFIQADDKQGGLYFDIGDKRAWDKTSQSLREGQAEAGARLAEEDPASMLKIAEYKQVISEQMFFAYACMMLGSLYHPAPGRTAGACGCGHACPHSKRRQTPNQIGADPARIHRAMQLLAQPPQKITTPQPQAQPMPPKPQMQPAGMSYGGYMQQPAPHDGGLVSRMGGTHLVNGDSLANPCQENLDLITPLPYKSPALEGNSHPLEPLPFAPIPGNEPQTPFTTEMTCPTNASRVHSSALLGPSANQDSFEPLPYSNKASRPIFSIRQFCSEDLEISSEEGKVLVDRIDQGIDDLIRAKSMASIKTDTTYAFEDLVSEDDSMPEQKEPENPNNDSLINMSIMSDPLDESEEKDNKILNKNEFGDCHASTAQNVATSNKSTNVVVASVVPTGPINLPLSVWIRKARLSISRDEYDKCAVTVALELTKFLRLVVGTNPSLESSPSSWNEGVDIGFNSAPSSQSRHGVTAPLLLLQIEDIVPENVMINVANAHFTAAEVSIKSAKSKQCKPSDFFETPQLMQRNVCYALGKICFELFSQGDRLLLIEMGSLDNNDEDLSELLLEDIDDMPARTSKRLSTVSTITEASPTKSMKAKELLLGQGLPLSICLLVSDLLEAEEGNAFIPDTAIISLEEAQRDLMGMITHPHLFMNDHTCPKMALEGTALFSSLDSDLYGREKDMSILIDKASRLSRALSIPPVSAMNGEGQQGIQQRTDFLCEAAFLSGHSGSGKSSIIKQHVSFCKANNWFVIICKFDRQVNPLLALLQSFDNFIGNFASIQANQENEIFCLERESSLQEAFERMTHSIISSTDSKSFFQLCELLPSLCEVQKRRTQNEGTNDSLSSVADQTNLSISSPGGVGSGSNRLNYLLHVIFRAVCSGGQPTTIVLDDLQWADSFTLDTIGDFIQSASYCPSFNAQEESTKGRLLLVGSYRDNEVDESGFLMNQIRTMEQSNYVNVERLSIGELPENEINRMLSFKFRLPMRHTQALAKLVYHKTRGLPMYIIEFLRSIIERNLITFSIKARRWVWDDSSIDIQMISEGVAELLTKKLRGLPHDVIEALKVSALVGQMNVSTMQLLDRGQFVPNFREALDSAVSEGIIDKLTVKPNGRPGVLDWNMECTFAFSHDMLQESTYSLISTKERMLLHKKIGQSLIQDPDIFHNAELCVIAADQANMCKDTDGILDVIDHSVFAQINLAAGKHSIAASSYEQARKYFEAGISLLHARPWEKQYSLCLELYEMSVVVSFMDGKVESALNRLDVILANTKSFGDTLTPRVLRARFLASQERHADATNEFLDLLSKLGEEFPKDASSTNVKSEIQSTQLMLKNVDKILSLPTMTNSKKLNAMKLMGLLITLANFSYPMLVPLLCCRMIKLTFESGFCEDSISGLAFMSHALFLYSDDIQLASRIGRIAESLINGHVNEHSLRAKLTQMTCTVKCFVEPKRMVVEYVLNGYNSAKIVGDVDNAAICGMVYCVGYIFVIPDLNNLQIFILKYFHQMAKHRQTSALRSVMALFNTAADLIGNQGSCSIDARIEVKTNKELYQIAEHTKNKYLLHHVIINQMYAHCYFREYLDVQNLAQKYGVHTGMNAGTKRLLDSYVWFFTGISAICLARQTKREKWKLIGVRSLEVLSHLASFSECNFENMSTLLQAELHYADGRNKMAELSYQSAIVSSHDHGFYHEQALASELFGIFLVENKQSSRGIEQLQIAMNGYKQWGAVKKARAVMDFMDLINQSTHLWKFKQSGAK